MTYVLCLAGLAQLFVPATVRAQVAVMSIQSVDGLLSDLRYLLTVADQAEHARKIDQTIDTFTAGKGLVGIDTTRPAGAYLHHRPRGLPALVVFVPIKGERDFLALLAMFKCQTRLTNDGVHEIVHPLQLEKYFLRFAHAHAYVSNDEALVRRKLPAPKTLLGPAAIDKTLSILFRLNEVPENVLTPLAYGLRAQAAEKAKKQPGESAAHHRWRVAGMRTVIDPTLAILTQAREVGIVLNVDQKRKRLEVDFSVTARKGTALAKSMEEIGSARDLFGKLDKSLAANLLVDLPLPHYWRELIQKTWHDSMLAKLREQTDPPVRAQWQKLISCFEPTFTSERLHCAFALMGPLPTLPTDPKSPSIRDADRELMVKDGVYAPVIGIRLRQGKKVSAALAEMVALPEISALAQFKLKHQKASDGSWIHLIEPRAVLLADMKRRFGTSAIYFTIRDDVAYASFGMHGLKALRQVLNSSEKKLADTPHHIKLWLSRMTPFVEAGNDPASRGIANLLHVVLVEGDPNLVHFRMSAAEDTLHLHLDARAELVKFVVQLARPSN